MTPGMVLRRITGKVGAAPVGRVMLFYSAALRRLRLVDDAGNASDISESGGGVSAHTDLTGLGWTASGHTLSAARRLAGSGATAAAAEVTYTTYTATLLDDADAATARTTLGVVIGTDVCAQADSRLSDSRTPTGAAGGDLAGTYPNPTVSQARGLRESGGTTLTMATLADGELLRRVGTTVDGIAATATPTADAVPIADSTGTLDAWVGAAVKGVRTNVIFVYVLPQAGTNVNLDGSGPTVSTGGILTPSQSEVDYFCTQFGDASAFYARWYVVGGYRTNQGTIVLNWNFRLGSDTTGSTQHGFMGLSSATTLATANPAGDIAALRWDVTTTNFKLFTKDNTTGTDTDTGVAVTPSYYYMVQMTFTAVAGVPSSISIRIGRGSTASAAASNFTGASTTTTSTTMPRSTVDLLAILSLYRLAASTNRSWRFNYFRMTIIPSWAA